MTPRRREAEIALGARSRHKAEAERKLVDSARFDAAITEFIEWRTFAYWVRLVVEIEGGISAKMQALLDGAGAGECRVSSGGVHRLAGGENSAGRSGDLHRHGNQKQQYCHGHRCGAEGCRIGAHACGAGTPAGCQLQGRQTAGAWGGLSVRA